MKQCIFRVIFFLFLTCIPTVKQTYALFLEAGFQMSFTDQLGTNTANGFRSFGGEGATYLHAGWEFLGLIQLSAGPSFGYQFLVSQGTASLGFINPQLIQGFYIGGDVRLLFDFNFFIRPYIKAGAAYDQIENVQAIAILIPDRRNLSGIRYNALAGFSFSAGPIWSIYIEGGFVGKSNLSKTESNLTQALTMSDNQTLKVLGALNSSSNPQNTFGYIVTLGTSFHFTL